MYHFDNKIGSPNNAVVGDANGVVGDDNGVVGDVRADVGDVASVVAHAKAVVGNVAGVVVPIRATDAHVRAVVAHVAGVDALPDAVGSPTVDWESAGATPYANGHRPIIVERSRPGSRFMSLARLTTTLSLTRLSAISRENR